MLERCEHLFFWADILTETAWTGRVWGNSFKLAELIAVGVSSVRFMASSWNACHVFFFLFFFPAVWLGHSFRSTAVEWHMDRGELADKEAREDDMQQRSSAEIKPGCSLSVELLISLNSFQSCHQSVKQALKKFECFADDWQTRNMVQIVKSPLVKWSVLLNQNNKSLSLLKRFT